MYIIMYMPSYSMLPQQSFLSHFSIEFLICSAFYIHPCDVIM